MRKLIFWGAHSIIGGSMPNRGTNIDFRQQYSEEKLFNSMRQKNKPISQ